jgi:hypothetical protein
MGLPAVSEVVSEVDACIMALLIRQQSREFVSFDIYFFR